MGALVLLLLLLLLVLPVLLAVIDEAVVVDEGVYVAIGAIIFEELLELTVGIVLFGNPMIEIFDPTAVELSLETVTGLSYCVVLAPITIGTASVCVFPALSVKDARPVVVVSAVSELRDGRLRLPISVEEGMGVPLATHAA